MAARKPRPATALRPPPPGNPAQGFMDSMEPYTYRYKDPADEPTDMPNGGKYLGIMAQDVEQAPTGDTLVKTDPEGKKYLETGPMLSALAASVALLNQRVKAVEGGKAVETGKGKSGR